MIAERHGRHRYFRLAESGVVAALEALISEGSLDLDHGEYRVIRTGMRRFAHLGVNVSDVVASARHTRRPLTRACLDWSERRYHLAGALGAALIDRFLSAGWVERHRGRRQLRHGILFFTRPRRSAPSS
ncbi:MAG: hypothetical protein ACRENC_00240 [Gemmatimonadaceae bacterium]